MGTYGLIYVWTYIKSVDMDTLNDTDLNYIYIILSPSLQEYNFKFAKYFDL